MNETFVTRYLGLYMTPPYIFHNWLLALSTPQCEVNLFLATTHQNLTHSW